jgi:SAM-dependent methyltransferase
MIDRAPTLESALRDCYAGGATPRRVFRDEADHGYIATSLLERSIAALAPRLQGRLLDVGCGTQPYRTYFAQAAQIVACDFDANRGPVDFTCPADQIPVEAGSFDTVLCTEVLEQVPDTHAVWREFFRILRPGGRVLLTAPMYWPAHEIPYDFYRYPFHGFCALVREGGFEIEELRSRGGSWAFLGQVGMHVAGHWLPARWMRRLWNRGALALDRARLNPGLSLGWTVLARKPG